MHMKKHFDYDRKFVAKPHNDLFRILQLFMHTLFLFLPSSKTNKWYTSQIYSDEILWDKFTIFSPSFPFFFPRYQNTTKKTHTNKIHFRQSNSERHPFCLPHPPILLILFVWNFFPILFSRHHCWCGFVFHTEITINLKHPKFTQPRIFCSSFSGHPCPLPFLFQLSSIASCILFFSRHSRGYEYSWRSHFRYTEEQRVNDE